MSRIIVAGSINMDVVARTTHHPQAGETVFGQDLHYIPGGKGSNQAVASSRLHPNVMLVGKLGRDPFGEALTTFLQGERLNLDHISYSDDTPSGVALITVNQVSENTIVVVSGSNYQLSPIDIEALELRADDIVVSVFEIPQETIKTLFKRARAVGATTVLNPAPATRFIEGLLPLVDYMIVNETELAYFAEERATPTDADTLEAHIKRWRASPQQTVIVTLGARGALCVRGDERVLVDGLAVEAIDTTGAGDCFTGAVAVALAEGQSLMQTLRFANHAAALSVQKLGASASLPTREALEQALAR
ncbi:MAG: ribokinase [Anaerolineae bacterium]